MTVARILQTKGNTVTTISPDALVAQAVAVLSEGNFGAIVASKDGKSVDGILSERDIVRRLHDLGENVLKRPVREIMTANVITCSPSDRSQGLLAVMTGRRIRHLPVVEDGELIGIISIGDVVKIRLDDLVSETEALQQYIQG